jgi:excisionase family DNA binding protein
MEAVRPVDEYEVQTLPTLMRYSRLGPIFSVRTDGPAHVGLNFSSDDTGARNRSRPEYLEQQPDVESDIIFTPEAAELLRATTQQTSELARKGMIPAFKVGKRWRFSRTTLLEWVEKASIQHVDLFSPSATPPSPPEPVKVKPKKRRNFPTDLSPEGLREALKAGNKTGNESASKNRRGK